MPYVIPAILILICLVGMGATASNYVGMTAPEAFDYCKTHHDYSISETEFNSVYNEYHDNPDYSGVVITQQDVNKVSQAGSDLYGMAVSYGQNIALPYILGSFDQTWTPETGSREVKYLDENGQVLASVRIYGFSSAVGYYSQNITTPPELAYGDPFLNLWFVSVDHLGNVHYHSDMTFEPNGASSTYALIPYWNFGMQDGNKIDRNASAITFDMIGTELIMRGDNSNNIVHGVYPQVRIGLDNIEPDLVQPDNPSIGIATYNGLDLPVNPDGSITLPNGTTVYPDTTTGLYPSDITVHLDDDYWARLAELLGANTATGSAAADTQTTNLNLEGLRSIASSTLDYLKNGFWTDFKNKLGEFFSIDVDKYRQTYQNPFNIIPQYVQKICSMFGYTSGNN